VRRRISRAIVGVAVLLVLVLGLPLALVVQRLYEDRAMADLQRRAAETINEVALPVDATALAEVAGEPDAPGPFAVYEPSGRRIFGPGPADADPAVRRALAGDTTSRSGPVLVIAVPLTDRSTEEVVGAIRISESDDVVDAQVRRAWAAMGAAVVVALAGAVLLARSQGRRLAEPVTNLARDAARLGGGALPIRTAASGIPEVDAVGEALAESAERLASLLARERAFSADVAHQLRTPLTGLRLQLERLEAHDAIAEVARLEATVEHLLALSRDRQPIGADLDVDALLAGVEARWSAPARGAGRDLLVVHDAAAIAVRASTASIAEVLDVLVDNALRHGAGTITVRARPATGGLVVEVSDQGAGLDGSVPIFHRAAGDGGHGIGLALARRMAEAEGGRLLLAVARPPCFHVVLPALDD
jgi:signal transduction histidine kinase